jgi:hypothetical protein
VSRDERADWARTPSKLPHHIATVVFYATVRPTQPDLASLKLASNPEYRFCGPVIADRSADHLLLSD